MTKLSISHSQNISLKFSALKTIILVRKNFVASPVITLFNRENSQRKASFSCPLYKGCLQKFFPPTVPAAEMAVPKAD